MCWINRVFLDVEKKSRFYTLFVYKVEQTTTCMSFFNQLYNSKHICKCESVTESLCQTAPPVLDSQRQSEVRLQKHNQGECNRQQRDFVSQNKQYLKVEMSDRKWFAGEVSEVRCDTQATEGMEKGAEDSEKTWEIPSLQELERLLHSAPRSCHHGDEVWPNLYLGDM